MTARVLRWEEGLGLALALAAHAGLVALIMAAPAARQPIPLPERVMVTLSDEVGLTSTSPDAMAQAAPDTGPETGEPAPEAEPVPPPPEPEPQPKPEPKPAAKPSPKPVVRPSPAPRPVATPTPRPVAKASPRPVPRPTATPAARPAPRPAPRATASAAPRTSSTPAARATTSPAKSGASRFDSAFKQGVPGAQATGTARNPPAAAIGPAVRSALAGAISREIKPRWVAPQGAEADKLVTILTWNLNNDGTLAGTPRVVRQEGITDANRPQAQRHAEQAIRAVQLAAPFDLPAQYYDAWKNVAEFRFDRRLSQ